MKEFILQLDDWMFNNIDRYIVYGSFKFIELDIDLNQISFSYK